MKQKLILILAVLLAAGVLGLSGPGGCGGGSAGNAGADDGEPGGDSDSGSAAPVITTVEGDGSDESIFQDGLVVTGENFTADMTLTLDDTASEASFDLSYTLESSTRLTANLPEDLVAGDYELTLTAPAGTAIAAVTLLRGETGPQGPAGSDGIQIAAQFSCGSSGDLDLTASTRTAQNTKIVRFSDGSYYLSCLVSYLDGTFLYIDTSSYTAWYAGNSAGVAAGVISCIPFYITADYSITGNAVTYSNQANTSQTQTVSCTQTYP